MSWELVEEVYQHSETRRSSDRAVLAALAHYAGSEGRVADPSVATLVKASRLGRSTVLEALDRLLESGEIEKLSEGRGRGKSTAYLIADLAAAAGAESKVRAPKVRQPPLMAAVKGPTPGPFEEGKVRKRSEKGPTPGPSTVTFKKEEERRPPLPPTGGRRRDWNSYAQELHDWITECLPQFENTNDLFKAVQQGLRSGKRSAPELDEFVRTWWPHLVPEPVSEVRPAVAG